jgi:hypothetical protein
VPADAEISVTSPTGRANQGLLRLLDGDFPDREFMTGIAEHNTDRALDFLDGPAGPTGR